MHNHYILNGAVEFHPATSTLRDLNDPDNVVVLNSPAGRCLLLLIERVGTIVTQHEFMDIVWAKRGMLVSSNTYYQNISILRKGLKKIGLVDDPVVTIPRIGLTLASGTQIKKLPTEQRVEVCHENAQFIDESSHAQDVKISLPFDTPESPGMIISPKITCINNEMKISPAVLPRKSDRFSHQRLVFWGICTLPVIALFYIITAGIKLNDESQYFSSYHFFLKTTHGCHIFLLDSIATGEARTKALGHISGLKESCANYPWMYITHLPLLPRLSVIRCDKPMNESNTCISDYFFEDK
ncbi:MAG: winged helix-turn-helix domain-containing protein [Ewingella sp.]